MRRPLNFEAGRSKRCLQFVSIRQSGCDPRASQRSIAKPYTECIRWNWELRRWVFQWPTSGHRRKDPGADMIGFFKLCHHRSGIDCHSSALLAPVSSYTGAGMYIDSPEMIATNDNGVALIKCYSIAVSIAENLRPCQNATWLSVRPKHLIPWPQVAMLAPAAWCWDEFVHGNSFIMIAAPQVQMAVGRALDLAAARKQPGVQRVAAVERPGEQKIAVVAGEEGALVNREPRRMQPIPRAGGCVIERGQLLAQLLPQPTAVIGEITLAAELTGHSRAWAPQAAIDGARKSRCCRPAARPFPTSASAARLARPSMACT